VKVVECLGDGEMQLHAVFGRYDLGRGGEHAADQRAVGFGEGAGAHEVIIDPYLARLLGKGALVAIGGVGEPATLRQDSAQQGVGVAVARIGGQDPAQPRLGLDLVHEPLLALLAERSLRAGGAAGRARSGTEHPVPSTREALEGITCDAARACWLEDRVGSLGIGKRADIVLLRELGVDLGPAVDLHATIVGSAHGSNVDTVIVDGEVVKRGGTLVGIDRQRVGTALAAGRERLLAQAAASPVAE